MTSFPPLVRKDSLKTDLNKEQEKIRQSISHARTEKPAYSDLYPFLESLFLAQLAAKEMLSLHQLEISPQLVETKWQEGFPLLKRWEFPVDTRAAEAILTRMEEHIPAHNHPLRQAHAAIQAALTRQPEHRGEIWRSFMHHEWEPWEEWVETGGEDIASLLFWARSGLRPSLEWVAEDLLSRFALPGSWLKGYCPVCGSLPSLLFVHGQGERRAHCSWCGSEWNLYRLQCPNCDNRHHESLGYLYTETEPHYHVHYCRLCKTYFKQIDLRERIDPAYLPLEEWTTLHLDLLAQRAGWKQAESPSPIVYGET